MAGENPNGKEIMKRAKNQSKNQPKSKLYGGDVNAAEPKSKCCHSAKKSSKKAGKSGRMKY